MNSKKAYTLIELVIVTGIIGLLGVSSFNLLTDYNKKSAYTKKALEVEDLIRNTQQKAQSGQSYNNLPLNWGIIAQEHSLSQFASYADYASRIDSLDFNISLPDPWRVSSFMLPESCILPNDCILFAKTAGTVSASGTIAIEDTVFEEEITITIYENGFIENNL